MPFGSVAGVAIVVVAGALAACAPVSREQALCTAAMHTASATTNLLDAMTALSGLERDQYLSALAFAEADLGGVRGALDQARSAQGGSGSAEQAMRSVLASGEAVLADVHGASSSDVADLRTRILGVQSSLEAIPGLPSACTDPIRPPLDAS